jgi:hypothetical protein
MLEEIGSKPPHGLERGCVQSNSANVIDTGEGRDLMQFQTLSNLFNFQPGG